EPVQEGRGPQTLQRLARATSGVERIEPASIWADLVRRPRYFDIGHWLLIAAAVILLLEVLERRTGALSMKWDRSGAIPDDDASIPRVRRRAVAARKVADAKPQAINEVPVAPQGDALLGALREAKQRGRR